MSVKNLTTLCYIEKDNCYLMLHRISKKNDINKDKWIGVGGHFEINESPEECLLRGAGGVPQRAGERPPGGPTAQVSGARSQPR